MDGSRWAVTPGSGDGQHHILSGRHFGIARRIFVINIEVGGFNSQLAAGGHRIARVDHEVEHCVFEFVAIGVGQPDAGSKRRFDGDRLSEGTLEKLRHAGDQLVDVENAWHERLASREGEETMGQDCGSLPRASDGGEEPVQIVRVLGRFLNGGFEVAKDE